jgi:hypothetical protein
MTHATNGRRYTGKMIPCKTRGCKNEFPERAGVHKLFCNSCNARRGVIQQHKSRGEKVPPVNAGFRKPWNSTSQKAVNAIFKYNQGGDRPNGKLLLEFVHRENAQNFAKHTEGVR